MLEKLTQTFPLKVVRMFLTFAEGIVRAPKEKSILSLVGKVVSANNV